MTQSDYHFNPPPASRETFKDLLRFEERLKQNAERLQRQRIKYEAFLLGIIIFSLLLAYKSFISPSPYKLFHYIYVGLLLVSVTTLILFFATGMYTDQIAYAYKFIPQTNRALRPFNMFLITPSTINSYNKRPATTTRNRITKLTNFFNIFRQSPPSQPHPSSPDPTNTQLGSSSPAQLSSNTSSPSSPRTQELTTPDADGQDDRSISCYPHDQISIQNINPRGEILFSTLVDSQFINHYQLYRQQWEIRQKKLNS